LQFRIIVPTDVLWCIQSPQLNTAYTSHVLRTKESDTTTRIRSVFQLNRTIHHYPVYITDIAVVPDIPLPIWNYAQKYSQK